MSDSKFKEEDHPRDSDGKFAEKGEERDSSEELAEIKKELNMKEQGVEPPSAPRKSPNPLDLMTGSDAPMITKLKTIKEFEEFFQTEKGRSEYERLKPIIEKKLAAEKVETSSTYSPKCVKIAKERLNKAKASEPRVTADIKSICEGFGGTMFGLDYRLKSEKSLIRKIATERAETRASPNKYKPYAKIAEEIKDALRFTAVVKTEELAEYSDRVLGALTSKGYKIHAYKNTFKPDSKYKGLNTNLISPDGEIFELQFHTPESINTKEQFVYDNEQWRPVKDNEKYDRYPSHKYYELARDVNTPKDEKGFLYYTLMKLWDKIPNPPNLKENHKYGKDS